MTALVLPAIPAFVLARHIFRGLLAERSDKVHATRAQLSAFLEEHMSSLVQIQQLQQEKRQERRAFHFFADVARSQVRLAAGGVQFTSWTNLPIAAAAAVIIGFGAWAALRGVMTVGGLVAFYSYVFQLFDPVTGALETYARAQRTFSSIRRLQSNSGLAPNRDGSRLWPRDAALYGVQYSIYRGVFRIRAAESLFDDPQPLYREWSARRHRG